MPIQFTSVYILHKVTMTKRKAFTIKEKLELVDRVRNGDSQAKIVKETGVNESTLRGWLRNEEKLRGYAETVDKDGLQRKKARLAADPQLDGKMLDFFVNQRDKGISIDGPTMLAQAKKVNQQLHEAEGDQDFSVSRGWLNRWKKRHGVQQFKANGESRSADLQAAADFIPAFQQFIEEEDLGPHQIYNADETGLTYKIQPDRTLAFKGDTKAKEGFKQLKDRLTLLLCCNWEGDHKLKPLCIGKFANPRCFHHINRDKLSVLYRHSKNAWMTRDLFSEWFHHFFVPAVRKHLRSLKIEEKAVLLLDNCPAHPPANELRSKDGRIRVYYLPKNTTSKIQPCDQGIIANFKRYYRHELIGAAVANAMDVPEFLKSRNIKDAFEYSGLAWQKVTSTTIKNCWNHALKGPDPTPADIDEDDLPLNVLRQRFSPEVAEAATASLQETYTSSNLDQLLNDWVHIDDDVPVAADPDEEEEEQAEEQEEPEAEPEPVTAEPVSAAEAIAALEVALKFVRGKGKETLSNVPLKALRLKSMIYDFKQIEHSQKSQKSIKDFFKMN